MGSFVSRARSQTPGFSSITERPFSRLSDRTMLINSYSTSMPESQPPLGNPASNQAQAMYMKNRGATKALTAERILSEILGQ